jgi:hypothetical protein
VAPVVSVISRITSICCGLDVVELQHLGLIWFGIICQIDVKATAIADADGSTFDKPDTLRFVCPRDVIKLGKLACRARPRAVSISARTACRISFYA